MDINADVFPAFKLRKLKSKLIKKSIEISIQRNSKVSNLSFPYFILLKQAIDSRI